MNNFLYFFFIFAFFSSYALEQEWTPEIYNSVQISYIEPDLTEQNSPQFSLPLTIISESSWSEQDVLNSIKRMTKALNQCSVGFDQIKLVKVQLSKIAIQLVKYTESDNIEGSLKSMALQSKIAAGTPPQPGITSYFLNSIQNSPKRFDKTAWAYGPTSVNRLKSSRFFKGINLDPLKDTTWMFSSILEDKAWERGVPMHSLLAHELVHAAGDYNSHPYLEYPNIMNSNSPMIGDFLNDDQCEHLRRSKLVRKI